ncbi:MAG: hypothetical protein ABR582_16545 [Gemmatimonadaceae bacterium]
MVSLPRAGAQEWNDPRTRALVEAATQRRANQIADTSLASYKALAHGYLTFLAQLGEGFTEPPKIVKADELALEVYWQAPNLSKQWIVGRRDTLLLPTDIAYHRDHLGIVQNNFPNLIRVGEGDEVKDVPHPLSEAGLAEYDFAIRDSLRIALGPRNLEVYEVRVRPKNDRLPRIVGAVFIDKESGEVVRMAFSFTRSALLDKELEDVSIVLENGLIDGRFWLPRRQEVEIRRTGTWLDYPVRGIIRGRWEICCYEVNVPLPTTMFAGPEILLAPPGTKQPVPFVGQILDSLPQDVRAVTDADVAKVQEEARALVRAQALARGHNVALSARGLSDFARVNRVEGLALGTGITRQLGAGFSVNARGRYGIDDRQAKARGELAYNLPSGGGASIAGYRDYRDASDEMERSTVTNSIASQEFGSDYTDPFDVRGASISARTGTFNAWNATVEAALERDDPLSVHASPASGRYEPTIPARPLDERRLSLALDHPTRLTILGIEAQMRLIGDAIGYSSPDSSSYKYLSRISARATFERPIGKTRVVAHSLFAAAMGQDSIPAQHLAYLGGPTTGPGYNFHEFAGKIGASQRLELQFPVPFPSFRLGRYGKTPATITLAPYANTIWIDKRSNGQEAGWFPSVGLGALTLFDTIRFDVARGLRDGRWSFGVDFGKDLWRIL